MLTVFFMDTIKNSFNYYLMLEKKYSLHTVNAYLNDIGFFEKFILIEFEQKDLLEINYSQIRSWIVSLSDSGISFVPFKNLIGFSFE